MAKDLFVTGYLWLRDIKHGMLDCRVTETRARVDVSDPNNMNDFLVGKQSWPFQLSIIKRETIFIPTSTVVENIVIIFGSEAYYGTGVINSVEESGRLDDKIIYSVQGQFTNAAYHLDLIRRTSGAGGDLVNSLYWIDDDGNGEPDTWIDTGSGSWALNYGNIERSPFLRSSWSTGGPMEYTIINIEYDDTETYRIYMPYRVAGNTIGALHNIYTYASRSFALQLTVGSHLLSATFTAVAGDDLLFIESWGDLDPAYTVDYDFILLGKQINSL